VSGNPCRMIERQIRELTRRWIKVLLDILFIVVFFLGVASEMQG
jgi:hypothetical protein